MPQAKYYSMNDYLDSAYKLLYCRPIECLPQQQLQLSQLNVIACPGPTPIQKRVQIGDGGNNFTLKLQPGGDTEQNLVLRGIGKSWMGFRFSMTLIPTYLCLFVSRIDHTMSIVLSLGDTAFCQTPPLDQCSCSS